MVIFPYIVIAHTAGIAKGFGWGNDLSPHLRHWHYQSLKKGSADDDTLMNAAMMFNTLIRDGSSLDCDDDENQGFRSLY